MKSLYVVFFFLFTPFSYADAGNRLFHLYQEGAYQQSCEYGIKSLQYNVRNENFVSLVGFSCLKADRFDLLSEVLPFLNNSSEARANNAYFSLLLLQKNLLMQALYDHKPISFLKLPKSSHLLSKVFNLYIESPAINPMTKFYQDPDDPHSSFKLYPIETNNRKLLAIDEYYDKILTAHHVF
ncbi:MAG: hypothetical protein AB7S65_02395 [Sulfuricurvum sp.]